jgi:hypothetical protein
VVDGRVERQHAMPHEGVEPGDGARLAREHGVGEPRLDHAEADRARHARRLARGLPAAASRTARPATDGDERQGDQCRTPNRKTARRAVLDAPPGAPTRARACAAQSGPVGPCPGADRCAGRRRRHRRGRAGKGRIVGRAWGTVLQGRNSLVQGRIGHSS